MSLTLEEALQQGQGVERPFRCTEHDDHTASASVNVLKGLWYCYACNASGSVDAKKAPKAIDLIAMLDPERAARYYPPGWLRMFEVMPTDASYWATRLEPWVVELFSMGEDPFTGQPTFPVYTPEGKLAGVGRRALDGEEGPRYRYPWSWAASRALAGYGVYRSFNCDVLVLTEGFADMAAVRQCGAFSLGCFGAGLHLPQLELIYRINPKVIITGFDMDDAGVRATAAAREMFANRYQVATVRWPGKDPNDGDPPVIGESIIKAVARTTYDASRYTNDMLKTMQTMKGTSDGP